MRIGGFQIFEKNNEGSRLWAAYHSPHSLTWRWTVSLHKRFEVTRWFSAICQKHNYGSQTYVMFGWWALRISTQKPMWYRDLYQKVRNSEIPF